jgi:hypothetical protein
MVIRRANEDTDQIARSLLQKAIRRGCKEVATAAFWHLTKLRNDFKWIRSRLAVFTFEEVWPYGQCITFERSEAKTLHHIIALCSAQKNKDAAGLGALGYAYSEGDNTTLKGDEGDWYIRVVSKALQEKDKFRDWALSESLNLPQEQARLVSNAIDGSKKAGWPWDKAFTYAAALLAIKKPVPTLSDAPGIEADKFPFWVAIDKHTKDGKEAIKIAAQELHIPANTALWLSFYFESAICQSLGPSPWWDRERSWRLNKLSLSETDARKRWGQVRVCVKDLLAEKASFLAERIFTDHVPPKNIVNNQIQLL